MNKERHSIDWERFLLCLGDGLAHGFLGTLYGTLGTLLVGVLVEAVGLMPQDADPLPWIGGGGVLIGILGFVSGYSDMWSRTK